MAIQNISLTETCQVSGGFDIDRFTSVRQLAGVGRLATTAGLAATFFDAGYVIGTGIRNTFSDYPEPYTMPITGAFFQASQNSTGGGSGSTGGGANSGGTGGLSGPQVVSRWFGRLK